MTGLTPVEKYGSYFFKRDDLYEIGGVRGGKVRTCYALAETAKIGLTTAGSRSSPQVNIVANIAKFLGLPCVAHTPLGPLNMELELAREAGCTIIQHKAGYNNVIACRSREYAYQTGYTDIPFGMEHDVAIVETMTQVKNIPKEVKRIVIPVGGGMSLAGVLHGINFFLPGVPVVGVIVGADQNKRLNRWAPMGWQFLCTLVKAKETYDQYVPTYLDIPFTLDPVYEAKCQEFLQPGDLLWCVGLRQSYMK